MTSPKPNWHSSTPLPFLRQTDKELYPRRWYDNIFNPWVTANPIKNTQSDAILNQIWTSSKVACRRTSKESWDLPLRWNAEAASAGKIVRVVCAEMADWLDPDVPTVWRSSLLHLIKVTPNITWLMVTRSPEHWRRLLEECRKMPQNEIGLNSSGFTEWIDRWLNGQPPANVWMGSVIRNPAKLEDRMNNFLQIPARLRFLFALPTQGDLDLSPWMKEVCVKCGKPRSEVERHYNPTTKEISDTPTGMSQCSGCGQVYRNSDVSSHYKQPFQWLVCDGAGAPVPAERVRSLRDQCLAKRLPFFFVGWGEWTNGILDTEKNKLALQDGRIIFPDPVSMDIWKWEAGSDSDPQNHVLEVSARLRYNVSSPAQREAWRSANNRLLDGVEYLEFPTLAQKENDAAKMHASRFPFKLH